MLKKTIMLVILFCSFSVLNLYGQNKNSSLGYVGFAYEFIDLKGADKENFSEKFKGLEIFAGNTTYFDKNNFSRKIVPLFDFSMGISFSGRGISAYSQYTGGVSFRLLPFMFINLDAGARISGLWNGSFSHATGGSTFGDIMTGIIPDRLNFDLIADASLCFHILYAGGVKFGSAFYFGTTGYNFLPYLSFVGRGNLLKDVIFKDFWE